MSSPEVAIPAGSWILVTGVNGFLASHVAKQLLERGYKVRGTVRDLTKNAFLVNDLFKAQTDAGFFELAHVPDLADPQTVNIAVKNVKGIIHIASDLTFDPDPNKSIPQSVSWTTNLLRAAREQEQEQSKNEKYSTNNSPLRFVFCSSAVAAAPTNTPGSRIQLSHDSWNDAAADRAWDPPPYDASRAGFVYVASKIEAERAMWKVVEEWPGLVANTILPGMFFGPALHRDQPASTAGWLWGVYNGGPPPADFVSIAPFLDVRDNALLHIACLLDPEVKNARIHAFGEVVNWNRVLGVLRKLYPGQHVVDDLSESPDLTLITTDDRELSEGLLRKWAGRDMGYISLEDSVRDNIQSYTGRN